MKWIGQHIYDLISRFRNDVYLEDISTGTIASGGNLGLDSNNKIVKANEPTSHDAVTLAGTPDYITLSGQEITRNAIDLANDVTGTLPVANGGTGATSLTDNAVLLGNGSGAVEASAHLTYSNFAPGGGVNTDQLTIGDASSTAGQVLTPGTIPMTVGPDASSGSNVAGANLTLQGGQSTGNAVGGSIRFLSSVAGSSGSSGNTINEVAAFDNVGNLQLDGGITTGSTSFVNSSGVIQVATQGTIDHDSLANFVAAEHYRWDTDISSTATINSANIGVLPIANGGTGSSTQKVIQVFPMNFVDDLGTDKHYMPFVTNTEQTVNYQEEAAMVMPADGKVLSVTVHYAQMHGSDGNITVGIETSACGQSYTNAWTVEETAVLAASVADDHHVFHFAFDNAKHFDSTDKMAISIQQSAAMQNASRFFWVTATIEYDWSTFLGGSNPGQEYTTTP